MDTTTPALAHLRQAQQPPAPDPAAQGMVQPAMPEQPALPTEMGAGVPPSPLAGVPRLAPDEGQPLGPIDWDALAAPPPQDPAQAAPQAAPADPSQMPPTDPASTQQPKSAALANISGQRLRNPHSGLSQGTFQPPIISVNGLFPADLSLGDAVRGRSRCPGRRWFAPPTRRARQLRPRTPRRLSTLT